jgi:hypothetical protein
MVIDDLNTPLRRTTRARRTFSPAGVLIQAVAIALSLSLGIFVAWALRVDDPLGGEPSAVATANLVEEGPSTAVPVVVRPHGSEPGTVGLANDPDRNGKAAAGTPAAPAPAALPPGTRTITIIDGVSGKRQEITIPDASAAKTAAEEPAAGAPKRKVADKIQQR